MSNDEFADYVRKSRWQYACTMPTIPHTYTTRDWAVERCGDAALFEAAAQFIRDHGLVKPWGSYRHTYYELDGFQYWTMGAPISDTTIINCEKLVAATYDDIAPVYDDLFDNDDARAEEREIYQRIAPYLSGRILDIGCGTGLLLDLHQREGSSEYLPAYSGLDPSKAMLARFAQKHPDYSQQLIWNKFEYLRPGSYNFIVSLFGSMNYVSPPMLMNVGEQLAPDGKYFLMFYGSRYRPVTYERTGLCVKHFATSRKKLEEQFEHVESFGHYLIAHNL